MAHNSPFSDIGRSEKFAKTRKKWQNAVAVVTVRLRRQRKYTSVNISTVDWPKYIVRFSKCYAIKKIECTKFKESEEVTFFYSMYYFKPPIFHFSHK